jgi:hypothetical protein
MLQESEKVFAANEIQLARLQRFGGQFVGPARNGGVQPQHFSGLRDPQDQGLPSREVVDNLMRPLQIM